MEATRDPLNPGAGVDSADDFNGSWPPTLRALGSLRGPQVMSPTPGPPYKR
jgi:hypothetical protein